MSIDDGGEALDVGAPVDVLVDAAQPDTSVVADVAEVDVPVTPDTSTPCQVHADCADGDPCTWDACEAGQCSYSDKAGCGQMLAPCDAKHPCDKGVCAEDMGACVSCNDSADCDAGAICLGHFCKPGLACKSDKDCKDTDQVCADDGACVDCASDDDCLGDDKCSAHVCTTAKPCASSKQCIDGVCDKGSGLCVECVGDGDCAEDQYCAQNQCAAVICKTGACTDDKAWFACLEGASYGAAKACEDDQVCTDGACDAADGCTATDNSAACDDGDACTDLDGCKAGACAGETKDCDDGKACTTDSCDKATGCVHVPLVGACDDADACTEADTCKDAVCAGTAKDCDDKDVCTDDACDPKTGCTHLNNEEPCDDENACTIDDVCKAGKCVPGTGDCDDKNPCTDDGCSPVTGCKNVPNTLPCDDGDGCTDSDTCKDGKCAGAGADCDDKNDCTIDSCDAKGGCQHAAKDSGSCNADDNACTNDLCQAGKCTAGEPKKCASGDQCIAAKCDIASGACKYTSLTDQPCDDDNPCTTKDACKDDVCKAGGLLPCDDADPCTTDSCNAKAAGADKCEHLAASGAQCDDGDKCTDTDLCKAGQCVGSAIDVKTACDDTDPCTTDACDKTAGCTHKATSGPVCDDADPCTEGETCADGKCDGGKAICACQDNAGCADKNGGNLCLGTYYCDKAAAPYVCKLDAQTVPKCDTSKDTACALTACDAKDGNCKTSPAADNKACDDGTVCTATDICKLGKCVGAQPKECDDKSTCTTDKCDPVKGCQNDPIGGDCDDGSACSAKDTCVQGKCTGDLSKGCDDGNGCTTDSCADDGKTCEHKDTTAACDDNNPCTVDEACKESKCQGGSAKVCDDKDACTVDTCDPVKDCQAKTADDGAACGVGSVCLQAKCVVGCGKDGDCKGGEKCLNWQCVGDCKVTDTLSLIEPVKTYIPPAAAGNQYLNGTWSSKHSEFWLANTSSNLVYRYDKDWKNTGKTFNTVKGHRQIAADVSGDLLVALGSGAGYVPSVFRLKEFSDQTVWKFAPSGLSMSGVAVDGDKVYATQLRHSNGSYLRYLYVLGLKDGVQQQVKSLSWNFGQMVIVKDRVFGLWGTWSQAASLATWQLPSFGYLGPAGKTPLQMNSVMFDGQEVCGLSQESPGRIWCFDPFAGCGAKKYESYFKGSEWLSLAEQNQLNTWAGTPQGSWARCMKKSDATYPKGLYEKCKDKAPTLGLYMRSQSSKQWTFGAYTTVPWVSENVTKKDDKSFLYNLDGATKLPIKAGADAVKHSTTWGPIYGTNELTCTTAWSQCKVTDIKSYDGCPAGKTPAQCASWMVGTTTFNPNLVEYYYPTGCGSDAGCNDDNACTKDTCGGDAKCTHTPVPGPCEDGDKCTSGDTCKDGK